MIVLIDGYNVLKTLESKLSLITRDQFIGILSHYFSCKKINGIIIFDSGPSTMISKHFYKNLSVVYVGKGHTADEYIIEYCLNHLSETIVLVTADRGILRQAERKNVEALDPFIFGSIVHSVVSEKKNLPEKNKTVIKKNEHSQSDIDTLMIYASSLTMVKKDEDFSNDTIQSNKISKKEKKRNRILKKL